MRLVIAEDQALLRDGLARLFRDAGHDVVATFGDANHLLGHIDQIHHDHDHDRHSDHDHHPDHDHDPEAGRALDLVVVDIRMPPTHTTEGIEAARTIKQRHPLIGVLVLSQHIEVAHAVDLIAHPGFGYLLKDRVLEVGEFLTAAERVANGGSALDPKVVATLVTPKPETPLSRLSEREREVLALMAEGLTNSAIAQRLFVSDRTVEAHVRHVLIKLDIPDHGDAHRRILAVLTHIRAATP